jgi:predicted ArsR family transcriptional regulator
MWDNKKRIMDLLEMNGGSTTNELSDSLGISATAVRRHLGTLEEQALIYRRKEQRGVGRPCFVYDMRNGTSNGFCHSNGAFVNSLFKELLELASQDGADELFALRKDKRSQHFMSHCDGESLSERVAALAQLLEQEGRLTTWQQLEDGHYILREHNCPFASFSGNGHQPCQYEKALYEEMLQADIERLSHISNGDVSCAYKIIGLRKKERQQTQERSALPVQAKVRMEAA